MKAALFGLICLVGTALIPSEVPAHALQPGYLELQSLGPLSWRAHWRVPDVKGSPMKIRAQLPENCDQPLAPMPLFDGTAWPVTWVVHCPEGLTGKSIQIIGLERTNTDVLVRYELVPGEGQTQRLTPDNYTFIVPLELGTWEVLRVYLGLGTTHILAGYDHLLFVFALLLLIQSGWRLVGTITAFTVAHSITLAASTLGWVAVSGPPVEAVIALSIMFLASEIFHRRKDGQRLSERYPWVIAFAFGLLHGFGFAGALIDIGLPQNDIPVALLSFNLGVELGQLMFVAGVLLLRAAVMWVRPQVIIALSQPMSTGNAVMSYVIGGLASYWFIERIAGF